MDATLLTDDEITAGLEGLDTWSRSGDRLTGEWRFENFAAAFAFMTEVAIYAERLNHHPEWSNVYNRVTMELTTHDAGGLTALDLELAGLVAKAAGRAGG